MTPDDLTFRVVTAEQIVDLRWKVLLPERPRVEVQFDGDDEPTTRHLGAFLGDQLIGAATIMRRPWNGAPAWQLRGMVIDQQLQGRGVGARLLSVIENFVRSDPHSTQLWCMAIMTAVPFYEKLGWATSGEPIAFENAGDHIRMCKFLSRT